MIVFSAELMDHIPLLTLIAVYTKDSFPDVAKKKKKQIKKQQQKTTTKKAWNKKILHSTHSNNDNNAIMGNRG